MPRWKPGQFPEGPPENYSPEDPYADPVALVEHREYTVRQKTIQVEKAKVVSAGVVQFTSCSQDHSAVELTQWQCCS